MSHNIFSLAARLSTRPVAKRPPRTRKLRFENLEDRTVPTAELSMNSIPFDDTAEEGARPATFPSIALAAPPHRFRFSSIKGAWVVRRTSTY